MTPLCELAKKHATDKGGDHYLAGDTCHTYTVAYWDLFKDKRDSVRHLLEVGVNYGCSLRMWEEFFPKAKILGLDSNWSCLFHTDRITCIGADQGNAKSLIGAMEKYGGPLFDVIIDDGSHELGHQILTANTLLPYLKEGGVYIIEDVTLDCQPESVMDHVPMPPGYRWEAIACPYGLGKAHCWDGCSNCHGTAAEYLIAIYRE
jgi:hypothetical protein